MRNWNLLDFMTHPVFLIACVLGAVAAVVLGVAFEAAEKEEDQRQWQAYSTEHHCKVVGSRIGSSTRAPVFVNTGGGRSGGVLIPVGGGSREFTVLVYECDDGTTHERIKE